VFFDYWIGHYINQNKPGRKAYEVHMCTHAQLPSSTALFMKE
jgi:hypothetical protein